MRRYKIGLNSIWIVLALSSLLGMGCVRDFGHTNECVSPEGDDPHNMGTLTLRLRSLATTSDDEYTLQDQFTKIALFIVNRATGKVEYSGWFQTANSSNDGATFEYSDGITTFTKKVSDITPGPKNIYAYAIGPTVDRYKNNTRPTVVPRIFNHLLTPYKTSSSKPLVVPSADPTVQDKQAMSEADFRAYYTLVSQENPYGFAKPRRNVNDQHYLPNMIYAGCKEGVNVVVGQENSCEMEIYRQLAGIRVWVYADESMAAETGVESAQISIKNLTSAGRVVFMRDNDDLALFKALSSKDYPDAVARAYDPLYSGGGKSYKNFYQNDGEVLPDPFGPNHEIYPLPSTYDPNAPDFTHSPDNDRYNKCQYSILCAPMFPTDWHLSDDEKPEVRIKLKYADATKNRIYKFPISSATTGDNILPNRRYNIRIILSKTTAKLYYQVNGWEEREIGVPAFE